MKHTRPDKRSHAPDRSDNHQAFEPQRRVKEHVHRAGHSRLFQFGDFAFQAGHFPCEQID
jgi:hypothetical protein